MNKSNNNNSQGNNNNNGNGKKAVSHKNLTEFINNLKYSNAIENKKHKNN